LGQLPIERRSGGAPDMTDSLSQPMTVLTSVYIDRPERWDYLVLTLGSFYRCCRYPGVLHHVLVDDRSTSMTGELATLCSAFGIRKLGQVKADQRQGFAEVYRWLLSAVDTEFFIYLEPDHYFYLPMDFLSPIIRLFALEPELVGVYLRAPMTTSRFQKYSDCVGEALMTYDGTLLRRRVIDPHNTGWIGRGHQHEGFSLMPTVWRTAPMREYFQGQGHDIQAETPYDLEMAVDQDWHRRRLTGYLNAQAFCYHIGAKGGLGGGHTHAGDLDYEAVWSPKIL